MSQKKIFLGAGWKSRESVTKLVDAYMDGELKVDEFVTHTMPLDKVNDAFDLMHAGKRCVQPPGVCITNGTTVLRTK